MADERGARLGSGSRRECNDVFRLRFAEMEGGEEGFRVLQEAVVSGIVESLLIGGEGRADVAPIGALGEINHEVDVLALPMILHGAVFVLGFEGFYLETVGMGAIGDDKIDGVGGIEHRHEDLPAAIHQPSADEEFVRVILVEPGVCICQPRGALGHRQVSS